MDKRSIRAKARAASRVDDSTIGIRGRSSLFVYILARKRERKRLFQPLLSWALESDGMDMEIDLSNLGTVNTMFAALFSKLGVPIKTTISAIVLEDALNGTVTVRPLPIGISVSGKVE